MVSSAFRLIERRDLPGQVDLHEGSNERTDDAALPGCKPRIWTDSVGWLTKTEEKTTKATANCCSFGFHMSATFVNQLQRDLPQFGRPTHAERNGSACRGDTTEEAGHDHSTEVRGEGSR